MSLSSPFIKRPVATTLLNLSVVLAGAVAFTLLPVSPLPQIDFPVIFVSANLPGASPETMASTVATPLERALGTIAGVSELSSNSSQGSARINVMFDLGKDINVAAREVQAAINASRSLLPSALPGMPQYRKINPSQAPIMILALTSKTRTTSEMYDLASTVLAQKVAQVTGVGDVTVGGGSLPAVRVELQPYALMQYGIALDEVRRSISQRQPAAAQGRRSRTATRFWQIQASDQLTKAKQYEPLIVTYRNGAPVRLSDIAKVTDGVEDRFNSGYFNTDPAVLLIISRQPDANIIETVDAITAELPALRAFLPGGVELHVASDRSPAIRATLHEAERSLLIAVALVIVVVLLFLANVRAAIIPVAAVPVSLVGSFAVMYLWGFSLNNLSLMALIVATGLVVDDAIVVLENISRHVEKGVPPLEAALIGAREVGSTLLSMNLAIVAVFVSMLFMGGIVERLFREFSITLVAAILISLVRLADADADAVRPLAQAGARAPAPVEARHRSRLRRAAARLRPHPGVVAQARAAGHLPAARRDGAERAALHRRAEELPPQPGHRTAQRLHPRRRRHVVPGDAAEDRGVPEAHPRRPGGPERGRVHRRRPRRQQRADLRPPQAAQRAQGVGAGSGQPHPHDAAEAGRRPHVPQPRSGHPLRRRGRRQRAVQLHAARRRQSPCCGSGVRRSGRRWPTCPS